MRTDTHHTRHAHTHTLHAQTHTTRTDTHHTRHTDTHLVVHDHLVAHKIERVRLSLVRSVDHFLLQLGIQLRQCVDHLQRMSDMFKMLCVQKFVLLTSYVQNLFVLLLMQRADLYNIFVRILV